MDSTLLARLGLTLPILQSPMAGAGGVDLAAAVCEAGGLGALPAAAISPETLHAQIGAVRQRSGGPLNVNFFVHTPPPADAARDMAWKGRLAAYFTEYGLDPAAPVTPGGPKPFGEAFCEVIEDIRPAVVSFHFGLPAEALLARVKAAGCVVLSSATSVAEARWLAERGADAVIAQGFEAGGHRGIFLSTDLATQLGTMALVPQVADAIDLPVIAAGGIADGRGLAAALALGASAAQIGTAYLFTPEAIISPLYRQALAEAGNHVTAPSNLFTGRPARGLVNRLQRELGPMNPEAPPFPALTPILAPLRAAAEAKGSWEFSLFNAGQAAPLGRQMGATQLTRAIAAEAGAILARLAHS